MSIDHIPDAGSNESITQEEARILVTLSGEARKALIQENPDLAPLITHDMTVEAAKEAHRRGGVNQTIDVLFQIIKESLKAAAIL